MDLLVGELLGPEARHEVDPPAFFDLRDALVEGTPRRQARTMRQQVTKRDRAFAVHPEVRKKTGDPVVEAELAVAREDHHRDRRRNSFGQRREIVNCVDFRRRTSRLDRSKSERTLERNIGAAANHNCRAGNYSFLDCLVKSPLDLDPTQPASSSTTTWRRPAP